MSTKLTPKQKAFIDYYVETGNATESAIKAGYNEKTAGVIASENLKKPYIREQVDLKMKSMQSERVASATEVLEFLTTVMRGETKDKAGNYPTMTERIKTGELLGKRYRLFVDRIEQTLESNESKLDKYINKLEEKL